MPKVLVVDDEKEICELIRIYLEDAGFDVLLSYTGGNALVQMEQFSPDLIILDLMLPEINGLEVCRMLRKRHSVPIIMLTAKGDELDRIQGLELGADDYVTKPFYPRELVSRVKSILRRTATQQNECITVGNLVINRFTANAEYKKQLVALTPKEMDLLWYLAANSTKVVSRSELLSELWGWEFDVDTRTIDAHIKRLRRKLDSIGAENYLHTVWGMGYKLQT